MVKMPIDDVNRVVLGNMVVNFGAHTFKTWHVGPNNRPLQLTVSWDHYVHVQLSTVSRSGRGCKP